MLTLEQVNELAETMIANGIASLEVKGNDYAVRLVRAPGAMPVVAEATGSRHETAQAVSPANGPFQIRGGDDGLAVLERGAQVLAGETLGYVGIGPVRLLCVSPATGRLVGRLPSQGETISTGDPLFNVETRK